jgi:hypothetical protein
LATITRQNTVAVTGVVAILLWRSPTLRRRPVWWLAALLPAAAGIAVHFWSQQRPDIRHVPLNLAEPAVFVSLPFVVLHLCGLSALPLLVLWPRLRPWRPFLAALVLMLAAAGYWLLKGLYLPYLGLFPYSSNMLTPWGAFNGCRLSGPLIWGDRPIVLENNARVFLSLLGCLACAVLLSRAIRWRSRGAWLHPLVLFALFQMPFLLIVPIVFDRYLLFLLPAALALVASWKPEGSGEAASLRGKVAALLAVGAFGLASLGLMHDWLAWNAARWELGRRALVRHLDPLDVEGGVEWDGWFGGPTKTPMPPGQSRWPVLPFTHLWFPLTTGHYALSFSDLPGARRLDAEPYSLWLRPGKRRFLLLELQPLPQGPGEQRPQSPPG